MTSGHPARRQKPHRQRYEYGGRRRYDARNRSPQNSKVQKGYILHLPSATINHHKINIKDVAIYKLNSKLLSNSSYRPKSHPWSIDSSYYYPHPSHTSESRSIKYPFWK
jgi:hypothetical protein